jgi:hypothetical protein
MMRSPQLLELLRGWWRAARRPVWLFPGPKPFNPGTERQINRAMQDAWIGGKILRARVGLTY